LVRHHPLIKDKEASPALSTRKPPRRPRRSRNVSASRPATYPRISPGKDGTASERVSESIPRVADECPRSSRGETGNHSSRYSQWRSGRAHIQSARTTAVYPCPRTVPFVRPPQPCPVHDPSRGLTVNYPCLRIVPMHRLATNSSGRDQDAEQIVPRNGRSVASFTRRTASIRWPNQIVAQPARQLTATIHLTLQRASSWLDS
jgi:hypothetical protein